MSVLIVGATIIDGVGSRPVEGKSIWIEDGRIRAIADRDELRKKAGAQVVDAHGQYVIPGLMNANVHLLGDVRLEALARYQDRFEELILEAAQLALKCGLTSVFDTWGPRRPLIAVRDQINAGKQTGSRIFCAGNIVGLDGPYSHDFMPKVESVASPGFVKRINAMWVENVGRHLMWLTPQQVAEEVRSYTSRGIDFVKYASNDHYPGAFLVFSPPTQSAIVEAAHRAGLTAQAHSMSVEGLRIAIEAGCDLIQHANNSGPVPIPEATYELLLKRGAGAVVFPYTKQWLERLVTADTSKDPAAWKTTDINARNLIRYGAKILLGNDASIFPPAALSAPLFAKLLKDGTDQGIPFDIATGHFYWFKAMEEKGFAPMEMLKAATSNIASAYGKGRDLGTVEAGKIADLIILEKNPLLAADNYRSIRMVLKDGKVVDREALPANPILTLPPEPPLEEESRYKSFFVGSKFPMCPTCMTNHDHDG